MRRARTLLCAVGLLAAAAAPARADGFIVPYWGYNFGGDSNCQTLANCEDKRQNFGVSLGKMGAIFGFEQDFAFARDFFGAPTAGTPVDNSVFTMMSNLLIGVGAGPVQPYVLAGFGVIRPHSSFNLISNSDISKYSLGYDLGVGINGFFSKHVGLRGDIRHMHTVQDIPFLGIGTSQIFSGNQRLDFWRASVGLTLR